MTASAVVLAAGLGSRLRPFTETMPKCLVRVGPTSVLEQALTSLAAAAVPVVTLVVGHRGELAVEAARRVPGGPRVEAVDNPAYATTGTAASLLCGLRAVRAAGRDGDVLVAEGDVWFDRELLDLLRGGGPAAVAVDRPGVGGDGSTVVLDADGAVTSWRFGPAGDRPLGPGHHRIANVYRFSGPVWSQVLLPGLAAAVAADPRTPLEVALAGLSGPGRLTIRGVPVSGCRWWEIDDEHDLAAAVARCAPGTTP